PLDQSPRNPAADLRARGTADSAAGRRRGLPGLSPARQRIGRARLVLRRPSAADCHCMVAQPPPAANPVPTHQKWRSAMKPSKHRRKRGLTPAALVFLRVYAYASPPLKFDFSDETVGAEPKSFVSVVGVWRIESDGGNKVLVVDGRQWKEGQTAASIADKARA